MVYYKSLQILWRLGRKKSQPQFLTSSSSIFHSLSLALSPLLHCFPILLSLFGFPASGAAHRTSTRSQEHGKYAPTRFGHVVMFSKSCVANKALRRQVSRRRPEEVQLSAKTSTYANVCSYEFLVPLCKQTQTHYHKSAKV